MTRTEEPAATGMHVVGIYRTRLASSMRRILDAQLEANGTAALWALDGADPSLAEWTVGEGPGGKFDLLNSILEVAPVAGGQYLIVTDDDISATPRSFHRLVEIMARGGIDLAQPAHIGGSQASHPVTRRRRFTVARLTGFVEIGPVFAIGPSALHGVVPFPSGMGMGWGLEVKWSALQDEGYRLGIVDAVTVDHPEPPNDSYSTRVVAEHERLAAILENAGLSSLSQLQVVHDVWRSWQNKAPWLR